MILVDTSVLIDYFRSKNASLLQRMQAHQAAICGVTRAEILCGARDQRHRDRLIAGLGSHTRISIDVSLWDEIGDAMATLDLAGERREAALGRNSSKVAKVDKWHCSPSDPAIALLVVPNG